MTARFLGVAVAALPLISLALLSLSRAVTHLTRRSQ
ncbi:hypothetical protein SUDANB91_03557 [Streptomyces sp. SudanB91_2054]